jgi:hypothetical protein
MFLLLAVADLAVAAVDVARIARVDVPSGSDLVPADARRATVARFNAADRDARDARRRIARSPVLWALGARGPARAAATQLAAATHAVAKVGRAGARVGGGTGPVPAADLAALAIRIDGAAGRLAAVPAGGRARAAAATARAAATDLRAVADLLGAAAPRRYLVALQNNAEMRDQGMVLSYAEIEIDGGRITLGDHGSVTKLELDRPAPAAIPAGAAAIFGDIGLNRLWESVNAGADFAWSAATMAAMYQQATGRTVDGVWALDIPALAELLRATGPVEVEGLRRPLTWRTAPDVLLHDIYEGVAPRETGDRRRILETAMQTVMQRATDDLDRSELIHALGRAQRGGHTRLWSGRPEEAAAFRRWGVDGAVAPTPADRAGTFHVAVESRTATKLDYYVDVAVKAATVLTKHDSAIVRTTVEIINRAPVRAPASYQLGPDGYGGTTQPGDYLAWVLLWGPGGAFQPRSQPDAGLQVSQETVLVPAGTRRTVTFETVIPNATAGGPLALRFVPQARLRPPVLQVSGPGVARRAQWSRTVAVEFAGPAHGAGPFSMRKPLLALLAAAAAILAVGLSLAFAGHAGAQGYPPTPTTAVGGGGTTPDGGVISPGETTPPATDASGNTIPGTGGQPVGSGGNTRGTLPPDTATHIPGDKISREVCAYKATSSVGVAVNGDPLTTVTADARGCITPTITVASCAPARIIVAGQGANAKLGNNIITFTGTASDGRPVVQTTPVEISCTRPKAAKKARNWLPIAAVGAGVVALLGLGIAVEARNRRRDRVA